MLVRTTLPTPIWSYHIQLLVLRGVLFENGFSIFPLEQSSSSARNCNPVPKAQYVPLRLLRRPQSKYAYAAPVFGDFGCRKCACSSLVCARLYSLMQYNHLWRRVFLWKKNILGDFPQCLTGRDFYVSQEFVFFRWGSLEKGWVIVYYLEKGFSNFTFIPEGWNIIYHHFSVIVVRLLAWETIYVYLARFSQKCIVSLFRGKSS